MHQLTTSAPVQAMRPDLDREWHAALGTVRRHRNLVLLIAIGVPLLFGAATELAPKAYTTHVKVITGGASRDSQSNTDLPVLNALLNSKFSDSPETYAELFTEGPPANAVAESLGLNVPGSALLSHIKVRPVPNTSIINVGVEWKTRDGSAQIANALAQEVVERRRSLIAAQAATARRHLAEELPHAEAEVRRTSAALAEFQSKNGMVDAAVQTQSMLTTSSGLQAKIAASEVDAKQARAQLADVQAQLANTAPTAGGGQSVAPNPALTQLQSQLAQVEVQLRVAQAQYTDQHPTVISLKAQKAEIQREIASMPSTIISAQNTVSNPVYTQLQQQAATYQTQIQSDTAQVKELRSQLAGLQPALKQLPKQTADLAKLQGEAKLAQDVYDTLQKKNSEAMVAGTTALSDLAVVEPADPATASVSPSLKLNLALGALLGIALGLASAFLVEFFDNRFKTEEDVESQLKLPVLASIPLMLPRAGGTKSLMLKSRTLDSFLHLITSLRYASSTRLKTIAFTSAREGEGKSSVALNAAIALAENEPRVLLVDADMRRPSLHTKLNVPDDARGLSDILVGSFAFESAVIRTPHPGLDFISAGTPTPNSYRLLRSAEFDSFLTAMQERYTTVILDSPAAEPIVDAAIVAGKCDGTVFVVAADESETHATRRALTKLTGAGVKNLLGVVLNKVPLRDSQAMSSYYMPTTLPGELPAGSDP